MFKYNTLDDFNFKGKVVGVRVDINSPQIKGKIVMNERIAECATTILELSNKGARVVILAHQGRKGKPDFVSLREHAALLEIELGRKVQFKNQIYSDSVKKKITSLKNSDILLLENVRFTDDEKKPDKRGNVILKLEKLFDYYVFDAFSVSHRAQTSVVGFKNIPNVAGRLMEKELNGLNKISGIKGPNAYVMGGAKADDLVDLLEVSLKKKRVDKIFLTGVIGEIALHIKGHHLGKKMEFIEGNGFMSAKPKLKKLLTKYPNKFVFMKDVVVVVSGKRVVINAEDMNKKKDLLDKHDTVDMGPKTVSYFAPLLKKCKSIYLKGPPGNFEVNGGAEGTKAILKAITSTKAFTFMGGGHSVTAAANYKFLDKFSYVSLAGGALVDFLAGKTLPGVATLESSFAKWGGLEDFVVMGSNVMDTEVSLPCRFSQVHLGDKVRVSEDFGKTLGGGGVNVSICLARLGAKVGYLGKLSSDGYDFVKSRLDKEGVKLIESKISKIPIGKSVILDTKDGDRVIFTYRGQNSFLEMKDFDIKSFRSDSYYLTSLQGKSFKTQIDFVKKIKVRNKNAVFCYNTATALLKKEKRLKDLIKLCDILVLNYEEAQELTSKKSVSDCLRAIRKMVSDIAIITDGSNGAYAYDGKQEYFVKAHKPKKVVDTTGAGDAFSGTFFYFYRNGYNVKRAMEMAIVNSASVVTRRGAQPGLLTQEGIEKFRKTG